MREKLIKISKYALGACAAILAASLLGLSYAPSAGIITLLSLQETKKTTIFTAFKRLMAFAAGTAFAFAAFSLAGYTIVGLGIYFFLFVAFCQYFYIDNAIAMCSVLITHYWVEKSLSSSLILNELLLLLIGAGIGVLLNLFLPASVKRIKTGQKEIETMFRDILNDMGEFLSGQLLIPEEKLEKLDTYLKKVKHQTQQAADNSFTLDLSYYAAYIDMRRNQFLLLQRVCSDMKKLRLFPPQAELISLFLKKTAETFDESNNAELLRSLSEQIRLMFKSSSLPKTREEFEARALLLHIFGEIEHFILLKYTFAQSLTDKQKNTYWEQS